MVLDPLTSFGLASNVFQLIDFILNIFDRADEIYRSPSGLTREYVDLKQISTELSVLSSRIKVHSSLDQDESELAKAAKSCKDAADELLEAIRKVGVRPVPKKWKSFPKALQNIWGKNKIDDLKQRLQLYRDALLMELVATIGYGS
jgi:hypothetical protein